MESRCPASAAGCTSWMLQRTDKASNFEHVRVPHDISKCVQKAEAGFGFKRKHFYTKIANCIQLAPVSSYVSLAGERLNNA